MSSHKNAQASAPSNQAEICSVLIIDDNAGDRALYKAYLRSDKVGRIYSIHEASSGRQGLEMFEALKPDCVLLDYMLPDMTGLELLQAMVLLQPILPVVMLTGQGCEQIAAETIKSGAQDYISKNIIGSATLSRSITNTMERVLLLGQMEKQNKQLKKGIKKAEHADKTKSEFLATMSHEIRTPLNGIIGMAELMGYTDLTHKQQHYLHSIATSGELLLTLINDILDFSKIEAGDLVLEERNIHLQSLLSEVLQLMVSRAAENRVELIVRWPHQAAISNICCDPVRLRQILINLVGNAIKFTKDGYVAVNIKTSTKYDEARWLRFEVEDNGIGIPADKIDHIFKQFSQVDSSTTREYGGTGLGLTICKKLIELMGGDIGVKSKVGQGSVFWLELECLKDEAEKSEPKNFQGILSDQKILIVDDCLMNVELFSEYLKDTEATVDGATTGQEALEKMIQANQDHSPYDLVLTDYSMPHMDGETLSHKVMQSSKLYGTPKLILMTGMGKKRSIEHLKQSGFSGTLIKPVYPKSLINAIRAALASETCPELYSDIIQNDMTEIQITSIKGHVLIVDDDRISMRMSRSILDELGCTYDTAGNGREAVEVLSQKYDEYDWVLMDWQMPVMDGNEAIREIRQQPWGEKIKIIALTANAIQGDREKCLEAGANSYLSKPVRVQDMVRALQAEPLD